MGVLSPQFGSLIPSPKKQTLVDNYLNFADGGGNDFAQQYLPEIYEAEVERYGNRTIGGFLRMVGAEMPMMSDQVVWSEQNRLHISYDNVSVSGSGANNGSRLTIVGADNAVFINQTIVIMDPNDPSFTVKCIVSDSGANTGSALGALVIDAVPYTRAKINANVAAGMTGLKMFVYGSEFGKGSTLDNSTGQSVEPQLSVFSNKPIIIRDRYAVSGSDTAQIGWVEVAAEDGTSGYLWYLKAEGETRLRFEDYLEMAMIEGELANGAQATAIRGVAALGFPGTAGAGQIGTEGLFAAINNGGNVLSGFAGFRRGSYDFYKTDMRYLNDKATRGSINSRGTTAAIRGVIVPAGTSSVYDQSLGSNMKRPFLHVRYRASQTDNRRFKTWVTGAVGATTSALDAMEIHMLSERCLITQGANNFMLMK